MVLQRLMLVAALVLPIAGVGVSAEAQTREATCRKVAGVITQVDTGSMSIAPTGKPTVSGRIDSRTHVTIDGQPGKVTDLQVTYSAKGQLCLDDVWTQINVDTH
jgi:hypothetical protein